MQHGAKPLGSHIINGNVWEELAQIRIPDYGEKAGAFWREKKRER